MVVWSGENYLTSRPLQTVRLSDLDALAGPSVGPIVTLEAPPLSTQRPDVEIGQEGGGGHTFPHVFRRSDDRLRFVVRGPSGGSTGSRAAVLAFQRPF